MGFGFRVIAIILFVGSMSSVRAGGVDRFFFNSTGQRLDPFKSELTIKDLISVEAKVKQFCPDAPSSVCIHWNLVLSDPTTEAAYSSKLKDALQMWSSQASLNLRLDYVGMLDANPTSAGSDEFGNSSYSGNFIVSFNPPAEIAFGKDEVSTSFVYVRPDLKSKTGEIKWAAIYMNPQYQPDRDYDLRTALAHEIGRTLGLAPSGVTPSVMYPVRIASGPRTVLHADDILWAGAQYGGENFTSQMGALSGNFLNGKNGMPWIGAHIQALPVSNVQIFEQSLNRSYFISGTFSREDGNFSFRALAAGNYILLAEPDGSMPASLSLLDAWLQKFSTNDVFESEFYDGKGRESNQEPVFAFSPKSILYAAQVKVKPGEETTGVTFVTNVADPKIARIAALGSSNEILADQAAPAEKLAADIPVPTPEPTVSGGGCEISTHQNFDRFNLLSLVSALFLMLLIRRDQKAK